jgi:hypothetical protein
MNIEDLRNALNEGVVLFKFKKKDGSEREARGTTNDLLIPAGDMPKGKRTPKQQAKYDSATVTFYDINAKGWRSMCIDTIWTYTRQPKKLS